MKRRDLLAVSMALLTLALLAFSTVALADTTYFYNFNSTLSPWTASKDPNVTSYNFSLARDDNGTDCPSPIDGYALLTLNSRTDNNAGIWMQASFPTTSSNSSSVTVEWDARDKGNCSNCKLDVYAAGSAPTSTAAFTSVAYAPSTWTQYTYSQNVGLVSQVYVALGWHGAVSGYPAAVGFDCVKINVSP